jgi:hypothetical protein
LMLPRHLICPRLSSSGRQSVECYGRFRTCNDFQGNEYIAADRYSISDTPESIESSFCPGFQTQDTGRGTYPLRSRVEIVSQCPLEGARLGRTGSFDQCIAPASVSSSTMDTPGGGSK